MVYAQGNAMVTVLCVLCHGHAMRDPVGIRPEGPLSHIVLFVVSILLLFPRILRSTPTQFHPLAPRESDPSTRSSGRPTPTQRGRGVCPRKDVASSRVGMFTETRTKQPTEDSRWTRQMNKALTGCVFGEEEAAPASTWRTSIQEGDSGRPIHRSMAEDASPSAPIFIWLCTHRSLNRSDLADHLTCCATRMGGLIRATVFRNMDKTRRTDWGRPSRRVAALSTDKQYWIPTHYSPCHMSSCLVRHRLCTVGP